MHLSKSRAMGCPPRRVSAARKTPKTQAGNIGEKKADPETLTVQVDLRCLVLRLRCNISGRRVGVKTKRRFFFSASAHCCKHCLRRTLRRPDPSREVRAGGRRVACNDQKVQRAFPPERVAHSIAHHGTCKRKSRGIYRFFSEASAPRRGSARSIFPN
jgi:hypothetical protein